MDLAATFGDAWTSLQWSPVSPAVAYNVYRQDATAGDSSYALIGRTRELVFPDVDLTNDHAYIYMVRAVSQEDVQSAFSNEATASPSGSGTPCPSRLEATRYGSGEIGLKWTDVEHAVKYVVLRGTSSGGPYTSIYETPSGNSCLDGNLANGTTFFYVVDVYNAAGQTRRSEEIAIAPVAQLSTPDHVTVTPGNGMITIAWQKKKEDSAYGIFYSTQQATSPAVVKSCTECSSYTLTGLVNGTTYYVSVAAKGGRATDHDFFSPFSEKLSAVPSSGLPACPSSMHLASKGNEQLSPGWHAVPGATGYRLYRRSGESPWTLVSETNAPLYTDVELVNGMEFHYAASTLNASGEGASGYLI
jgi:fibronectin type 3 domain-containing protein